MTSLMTQPWTGFPTLSVSLLSVSHSRSLESLNIIIYLHTNPHLGLCFLKLPSPSKQRTWYICQLTQVLHTYAHLRPSVMCAYAHIGWDSSGLAFFICIKEFNCSQGKWIVCPFSLIRVLVLDVIISYATVDYITKNPESTHLMSVKKFNKRFWLNFSTCV